MCRPVTCKTCGKTTWAGCGQHVAQVKAAVPAGQLVPRPPQGRAHRWQLAEQDPRPLTDATPTNRRGRRTPA